VVCALESRELMALCLKRLKNLQKVKLIDANFVWTEPHSKRIKVDHESSANSGRAGKGVGGNAKYNLMAILFFCCCQYLPDSTIPQRTGEAGRCGFLFYAMSIALIPNDNSYTLITISPFQNVTRTPFFSL
jgi:hypothetical protein